MGSNSKKHIPSSAITIRTYDELLCFANGFAQGRYNLLAVVGTGGLSKSKSFEAAMNGTDHCLIKGQVTPFVMYQMLYDQVDEPVVIDDADTFFETKAAQPLLKNLCDTNAEKRLSWQSKAMDDAGYPRNFVTRSKVTILCNSWKTVSQNMAAVVDRAIFLNFVPSVREVHRQVGAGGWYDDPEVYEFIGRHLSIITTPSMRYYTKGAELHRAGHPNWQDLMLKMLNPDLDQKALEIVSRLLVDDSLNDKEKVEEFKRQAKMSRATYYRYKGYLEDAA